MRGTLLVSTARGAFAYSASKVFLVLGWTGCPLSTRKQRYGRSMMSSSRGNQEDNSVVFKSPTDNTESIRLESEMEMEKVAGLFKAKSARALPLLIHTQDQLASFTSLNQIHNYLFDCDGVLYRGADPMPSASRTIQYLINSGRQVFFVTNNASSTRMELKWKLEEVLEFPKGLLKEEMMIGSAYVASRYLSSRLLKENDNARVHVIGTSGLCQEFQSAGFDISGGPDIIGTACGMSRDELAAYPFPEGEIDAMVIGLDPDFNYRKLCIATVLLQRNPHAILLATNRDSFDLVGVDARHLPGNGAVVCAVEAASGRSAINVGKPSLTLSSWIMDEHKLMPEETMMVGDRLDTDVKFGNTGGMKISALVLTGCTTATEIEESLLSEENDAAGERFRDMMPTIIFPHVGYMSK